MGKNLLLTLSALVFSLILSEIIFAVLGIPKFYQAHSLPRQFRFSLPRNGELFYTNVPSERITFQYDANPRGYFDNENKVVHTTNSVGFRGKEFSEEKSTNTIRIAFLGDSFTFGEGVKDDDIFTVRIEKYLNEKCEKNTYECLNFGVGGYNTEQYLSLLKQVIPRYNPDIVILCFTLNDVEPSLFHYDKNTQSIKRHPRELYIPENIPDKEPPKSILYKFRVTKLIWQAFNKRSMSERTVQHYYNLFDNSQLWEKNRKLLHEYIDFCRENRITYYVTILPLLYKLNGDYPFLHLHQKVEDAIADENVFIDLLTSFMGYRDVDLWVHPSDQHPNEIAHEIIASTISEFLLTHLQECDSAGVALPRRRDRPLGPRI
jgi:hypothetical protein